MTDPVPDNKNTRTLGGAGSAPAPAQTPKTVGPYTVLGVVAQGGMGVVYRVQDPKLDRAVALKMLIGGAWSSEEAQQRFLREAQLLAELSHPGIVPVHDMGVVDGAPYYTMDLVEGKPLDRIEGSLEAKLRIFRAVCEAVHHAHMKGVIHRDLKPGNVLVGSDGHPVILDFGIARLADQEGLRASLMTMTGVVMGTPAYMSPEQAQGKTKEIDTRTDVYALGVILYEMVTGKLPFEPVETFALLKAVVETEPKRPSSWGVRLDKDLEAVILKAMAKEPARRYASAQALAEDLGRFLEGKPVSAQPDTATYKLGKWAKRHKELAAAAVVLLVLGGWAVWRIYQEGQRAKRGEAEALRQKGLAEDRFLKLQHRAEAENLMGQANLVKDSDPTKALALLDEAIRIDPEYARVHSNRAVILLHMGRLDEALQAIDRAIGLDAGFPAAHVNRGLILQDQGKLEESLKAYDRALEIDPHYALAYYNRGVILQTQGKLEEALKAYDRALEIDPRDALAHHNRGVILQTQGKLEEALKAYDRALEIDSRYAGVHYNRGIILQTQGKPNEALKAYETTLALRPAPDLREACLKRLEALRAALPPSP